MSSAAAGWQQLLLELHDVLGRDASASRHLVRTPLTKASASSAHATPLASEAAASADAGTPRDSAEKRGGGSGAATPGGKQSSFRSKVDQGQVNDQDLTDYFASLLQKPTPSSDRCLLRPFRMLSACGRRGRRVRAAVLLARACNKGGTSCALHARSCGPPAGPCAAAHAPALKAQSSCFRRKRHSAKKEESS